MSLLGAFRERRPFPGQDPWVATHASSFLLVQSAGGNRRLCSVPLFWDPDGYPLVQTVAPPSGERVLAGASAASGFVPGNPPRLERAA